VSGELKTVEVSPAESVGTVSRSKAELLREWGWKGDATSTSVYESVEEELDEILNE
jgi:hypothetical protein